MDLVYDRSALVHAYLAAAGKDFGGYYPETVAYNNALQAHHQAMLDGLQQLFGLRLSHEDMPDLTTRVLFHLFRSTADSLHRQATPFSGYLEGGLLIKKLEEAGDAGARVMTASDRIAARTRENRADHLEILDAVLSVLLGDRAESTFTAADLRAAGVDPEPPSTSDYELYDA